MDPAAAERYLRSKISVTPTLVTLAKRAVLESIHAGHTDFEAIVGDVLRRKGITPPKRIVVNPVHDSEADLVASAHGHSWRLAISEALWGLVHSGQLVHMAGDAPVQCRVDWTTIPPGGGSGTSAGWEFRDLETVAPSRVRLALSSLDQPGQFLTDPDLFIGHLGAVGVHVDVEAALRESVRCFRHELYTASLAMLGKASEGAWLDLGGSLLRVAGPTLSSSTFKKQREVLEDPMFGPLKKVGAVLQMYERQEHFKSVVAKCSVRPTELRQAEQWSDTVRDSRNTIHFGVAPALPNTYEKVAVLLLAAAPNLRTLYAVKEAADSFPPGTV
jgi:hypothetical protein